MVVTWSFWHMISFFNAEQLLFTQQHKMPKLCFVSRIHKLWICFRMTFLLLKSKIRAWLGLIDQIMQAVRSGEAWPCVFYTWAHRRGTQCHTGARSVGCHTILKLLFCIMTLLSLIWNSYSYGAPENAVVISVSWGGFPVPQVGVRAGYL